MPLYRRYTGADIVDATVDAGDTTPAVQALLTAASTAYQRPGAGIPSTDMATGVQAALTAAGTAYQKPGTGIPSTDLAAAVQTSLGKADAALPASTASTTYAPITGSTAYPPMVDPRFGVVWQSGRYYYSTSFTGPSTSAVLGVGSLRAAPILVPSTKTVIRIGAEVTSTGDAGSKYRLGIYADDGTGRPGALILDAGQIAGDSATVQEITISQSLTKGWFWLAGVVQSVSTTQPTVRILGGPSGYVDGGTTTPAANGNPIGFLHNGTVSGALPDPFVVQTVASSAPRLFLKTA